MSSRKTRPVKKGTTPARKAGADLNRDRSIHCSFESRAFTDLVTNSTFLPQVELGENLDWFFQPGGMPVSWLASFLHEAVHHWTFHTVVGSALAGLQLRARLRILEGAMGENEDAEQDAIEDIVRFERAITLLRPIAEGLAMFCEFDVMPMYRTPVISRPMTWAYQAFTRPDQHELHTQFGTSLNFLLQEMRFNDRFIRRKTNVYLEPLTVGQGDYLVGYLTVKSLWQQAMERRSDFGDADLFYVFLKRYFYSDYGLVERLLQRRTIGKAAEKELLDYFAERLISMFYSFDWGTHCERLLASFNNTDESAGNVEFPSINTDKEVEAEGKRLLEELIRYFEVSQSSSRLMETRSFHFLTLAQRHIMRLASFPVSIVPRQQNIIAVKSGENLLFEVSALDEWRPVNTEAVLDLYISISNVYRVATVSVGMRVVAVKFQGRIDQAQKEQFLDSMGNRGSVDDLQEVFRLGLDTFIDASGFRPQFESDQATFKEIVDRLYAPAALWWVRNKDFEDCRKKLKASGLLGIVNDDPVLLKSLAGLTLCASFLATDNEAQMLLPQMEMPVAEAMRKLEECAEKNGMPLVFAGKSGVLDGYV